MVKNLSVYNAPFIKIDKKKVHLLISGLKELFDFKINSLSINFISSEDIIPINSHYLKHSGSTDIITFNYSEEYSNFDGEIFISCQDAEENAKKFKVSFDNELLRLLIHGVLHLLGYDDIKAVEKKKMKKIENELVLKFEKKIRKLVIK